MKSILQKNNKKCLKCNSTKVDLHHVRLGNCSRAKAEEWGLLVWLCRMHHEEVHRIASKKKELQAYAQLTLEQKISHDVYMEEFRKNYL